MQCNQRPFPHRLTHSQGAPTPPAGTFDDADDAADWVSSLLDAQLESVDDALAEARRAADQPAGEGAVAAAAAAAAGGAAIQQQPAGRRGRASGGFTSYMDAAAQLAPRPQEQFADPVDNSRTPFAHKLDSLAGVIDVEVAAAEAAAAAAAGAPRPHPLAPRLQALAYPAWQLEVGEAVPPKSNEETPFTYIDSVPALRAAGALVVGLPAVATLCGQWVRGGVYVIRPRLLKEHRLCAPADAAAAGQVATGTALTSFPMLTVVCVRPTSAVERLAAARELAVDLEAHNYRSFQVRFLFLLLLLLRCFGALSCLCLFLPP